MDKTLEGQLVLIDREISEAKSEMFRIRERLVELRRAGRDIHLAQEAFATSLVTHSVLTARREIILIEIEHLDNVLMSSASNPELRAARSG